MTRFTPVGVLWLVLWLKYQRHLARFVSVMVWAHALVTLEGEHKLGRDKYSPSSPQK